MLNQETGERDRKLGGHNQSVPIVALTASVVAEQVMSCTKAGFTDHIGKPIEFEQFLGRMERWAKRLESSEQARVGDDLERMAG
jgi:CheY-like chemotaxis protein